MGLLRGVAVPLAGGVPRRWLLIAALLSLLLGVVLRESAPLRPAQSPAARGRPARRGGLAILPPAAIGAVSGTLGAADPAYRISSAGAELRAQSSAQRLQLRFASGAVLIRAGATSVSLGLRALGYGGSLRPVGAVKPSAAANRVSYVQRGISEWYRNGPAGLEQGFTIPRRPAGRALGPLTLSLALGGNARASLAIGGRAAVFRGAAGTALRYDGLLATDARGSALPSWLELSGRRLLLRVDARAARFPITIDPLVQQGNRLSGLQESGAGQFGSSVAISADASTAVVGGPDDANLAGAAWVFARAGSSWKQQGPKLTPTDESGGGLFGSSVAISAAGNTVLIGAPADEKGSGAAWVFARSGATWSQQGSKISAPGSSDVGTHVALSADGNTAILSAVQSELAAGALVYSRLGPYWNPQASLTNGEPGSGASIAGVSVALSADGNTALVGGNYQDLAGAVWVFIRSGSEWSRQAGPLTGAGESGPAQFGLSGLALSAAGNLALIGGAEDAGGAGAAWVLSRAGTGWSQQGPKLTAPGSFGLGSSVALSADGSSALIGAPQTHAGNALSVGAAWSFARLGSDWTRQEPALHGGTAAGLGFGASVALSANAGVALVGGASGEVSSTGVGAVWVFASGPTPAEVRARARAHAIRLCERRRNRARRKRCIAQARKRYPVQSEGKVPGPVG